MRIMLSITNLGIGGVQTYLLHLARGLASKHQVWVYSHYPYSSDSGNVEQLGQDVKISGPHQHVFCDWIHWKLDRFSNKGRFKWLSWKAYKQRDFLRVLTRNNIDAIISFDRASDLAVSQLKDQHGLPVVLSLHGNYDIDPEHPFTEAERTSYRYVFSRVEGITYKTQENIRLIRELGPFENIREIRHVLHGYSHQPPEKTEEEIRNQLGIPVNAFVFSMIARGDPAKGWEEALQAFLLLLPERKIMNKPLRLICMGDGHYMDDLEDAYGKYPEIIFVKPSLNVGEVVQITDVGLLPSYFKTENYSFSIIQYLSAGKPVIASRHGAIPETLSSDLGEGGILLPLGPEGRVVVSELHRAMAALIENPEMMGKYQKAALAAFGKFNINKSVQAYEELLSTCLSEKQT